jgi:S1-C subfamily serine protease
MAIAIGAGANVRAADQTSASPPQLSDPAGEPLPAGADAVPAAGASATPATPAPGLRSVAELFRDFASAVVRVKLIDEEPDADGRNIVTYTTGFIINDDGLVLTSFVSSTQLRRVIIEKDGLEYGANFLGGDVRTQVALARLMRMPERFAVIPLAGPQQSMPIGAQVMALTLPLDLDVSPSPGVITGYESGFAQYVFPCSYQRTNIPLANGEGGAPVLDGSGQLVGVMVATVPELRSSYLVTPNSLRRIVGDLVHDGRVDYGRLPLELAESVDAPYVTRRIVVTAVDPGGAAERAGVRPGDIVRNLEVQVSKVEPHMAERSGLKAGDVLPSVGVRPFRRIADVRDTLFNARPGDYVRIELERDGKVIPFFTLPVGEPPRSEAAVHRDAPAPGNGKSG